MTLLSGSVSGTVRGQNRRLRGFVAAGLAFDNFLGEPTDRSADHVGRFGPRAACILVDDDSNNEPGTMYTRPYGNQDHRPARCHGPAMPIDLPACCSVCNRNCRAARQ